MALCFSLARPLLTLLGTKDELIDGAILYLRIYAFGLPAMALYNFGSAVLTATGDTKRPLLFLSIAGGLNICLNLFFVIVCKMAADGVALATIISQYTSAALVLRVLLRAQESYRLELKNFVFSVEKAQRILALGVASGMQHAIFRDCEPLHSVGGQLVQRRRSRGKLRRSKCRLAGLRGHGRALYGLLDLHQPELRRAQ